MRGFIVSAIVAFSVLASAPAFAWSCGGTVHGLGSYYDPATGAGFLAVRAGPRVSASQIGELFNGDEVTIVEQSGRWYRIDAAGIGLGWAHSRWIRSDC